MLEYERYGSWTIAVVYKTLFQLHFGGLHQAMQGLPSIKILTFHVLISLSSSNMTLKEHSIPKVAMMPQYHDPQSAVSLLHMCLHVKWYGHEVCACVLAVW